MKRIILALALFVGSMTAYAQSEVKNDTIAVVNSQIKKVVQDETVNAKGKKVVKYISCTMEHWCQHQKALLKHTICA